MYTPLPLPTLPEVTSNNQYDYPRLYRNELIKFFSEPDPNGIAYLGFSDPSIDTKNWSIDDGYFNFGMNGKPLDQILRTDYPIFSQQRMATTRIIDLLFNIYAIVNNLKGKSIKNRYRDYKDWITSYTVDDRMNKYLGPGIKSTLTEMARPNDDFKLNIFLTKISKYITDVQARDTKSYQFKLMLKVYSLNESVIENQVKMQVGRIKDDGDREHKSKCQIETNILKYKKNVYTPTLLSNLKDIMDKTFTGTPDSYDGAKVEFNDFLQLKKLEYLLHEILTLYEIAFCHIAILRKEYQKIHGRTATIKFA